MENHGGRRKAAATSAPRKKLPAERVFGASSTQQLPDANEAFKLVGRIVEKGVAGDQPVAYSSAPPRPSVIPFPVARHRSHGPHWAPPRINGTSGVDDEDEDDEESDTTNYDPIADFANPMERKKKKGLDLSKWRELLPSHASSNTKKMDKSKIISSESVSERQDVNAEAMEVTYGGCVSSSSSMEIETNLETGLESSKPLQEEGKGAASDFGTVYDKSVIVMELDRVDEPSLVVNSINGDTSLGCEGIENKLSQFILYRRNFKDDVEPQVVSSVDIDYQDKKARLVHEPRMWARGTDTSYGLRGVGVEQESDSLESQIDAENQARLQSMSPAEIAEAQGEIRNKISPQLLNLLMKRGKDKLENQRNTFSGPASNNGGSLPNKEEDEFSPAHGKGVSVSTAESTQQNAQMRLDKNVNQPGDGLWDAWSKRVEAARDLRFSLDGNVVQSGCHHSADIENNLVQVSFNADNVAERDYLRTEGDPAAAGYTIKETLSLARSVIPGQRSLALHLIASVLTNAMQNILQHKVGQTVKNWESVPDSVDWEAVWSFALGPEPELVLSLRIALDDNHDSVVLACARAIQCMLACDLNEHFFDISEKMAVWDKQLYTAPVCRAKPDIDGGFLHGGFWKYSAKSSNILLTVEETVDGEAKEEQTIKDDNIVAGQDIAAGLVRMGLLPRLCFLLETEPAAALEECIMSILIAIARHSPTCMYAVFKCERLIQTVVDRFNRKNKLEAQASRVKSVKLMRVLTQSEKRICSEFVKNGTFERLTWNLCEGPYTMSDWVAMGKECCKNFSLLMVEQLKLWKVCLKYGHCVSYFTYMFPALFLWMSPPSVEKLIEKDVLKEFASITKEIFLVLGVLAEKLPSWYCGESMSHVSADSCADDSVTWCWKDAAPVVDIALKWMVLDPGAPLSEIFDKRNGAETNLVSQGLAKSLLWVCSSVLHLLCTVIIKLTPPVSFKPGSGGREQLPELVARIGLPFIKNGFLSFSDANIEKSSTETSFVEKLCHCRLQTHYEMSLASVSCLHGLLRLVVSVDHLSQLSKKWVQCTAVGGCHLSGEKNILDDGIFKCSHVQWRGVLCNYMKLLNSEWEIVQSVEVFGRGGPAPGVGLGWGASGGGFWSLTFALAEADARLLIDLLEIFLSPSTNDLPRFEETMFTMQMIGSLVSLCSSVGPNNIVIVKKAFDILLRVPVMKYLNICLGNFLCLVDERKMLKLEYNEDDLMLFSSTLSFHFGNRWLSTKRKKPSVPGGSDAPGLQASRKGGRALETIHEDLDTSIMVVDDFSCLAVEWAHQRVPLPTHWLLSPITTINKESNDSKNSSSGLGLLQDPVEVLKVAQAGLFFLLSIEAVASGILGNDHFPIQSISLVWKFHSLSMPLLSGMGVLEDDRSRGVFEALQGLYGQHLDDFRFKAHGEYNLNLLRFKTEVHDSYATFIETLVEQFAAISYGDLAFGRQVAVYLHGLVEAPVRLAAWNALSNARVLELLPTLGDCIAESEGYLEPLEEDEGLLEAYVKAWVSGALDRAAIRGSAAYTIALHHLSVYIFYNFCSDKLSLKKKFVKSLLRDFSRKPQHEDMILNLVHYAYSPADQKKPLQGKDFPLQMNLNGRFQILAEGCDGNSSLLALVEKLKSASDNKKFTTH